MNHPPRIDDIPIWFDIISFLRFSIIYTIMSFRNGRTSTLLTVNRPQDTKITNAILSSSAPSLKATSSHSQSPPASRSQAAAQGHLQSLFHGNQAMQGQPRLPQGQ